MPDDAQHFPPAQRRLLELLERTKFLAVLQDAQGNLEFCNDALLRLAGRTREEVLGRSWFDLFVPPGERNARRATYLEELPAGVVNPHPERESLAEGGKRRVIESNVIALRDESGQVLGCASIGHHVGGGQPLHPIYLYLGDSLL